MIPKNIAFTLVYIASFGLLGVLNAFDVNAARSEAQNVPEIVKVLELLKNDKNYPVIYFGESEEVSPDRLDRAREFMLRFYGYFLGNQEVGPEFVRGIVKDESMSSVIQSYGYQLLFFLEQKTEDALQSMVGRPGVGIMYLEYGIEDYRAVLDKYFLELQEMDRKSESQIYSEMQFLAKDFFIVLNAVLKTGKHHYFTQLMSYYPDRLALHGAPSPRVVFDQYEERLKREQLATFAKAVGTSRHVGEDTIRQQVERLIEDYESNLAK